jgi:asparagine synthase (glutamine-hydrolysing)
MCGIAGFWSARLDDATAVLTLRGMTDALVHRGPDDAGAWCDPDTGVALGHRRLSIVDLSPLGHQPMASVSERFQIAFNGEIYNFRALREALMADGATFRGHSDTEVLLALIERHGLAETLTRCTGMFAIALWDRATRTLQLARDRFGEKPLYVARCGAGIAFASELKAIRVHPEFHEQIDPSALALFLRHGYVPAPYAIFQGVEKVLPGEIMTFSDASWDARTRTAYWSVRAAASFGLEHPVDDDPAQNVEALDVLMREVVRDQMVADVPIGAFLSGGIDSSLVVGMMQAESARPVRTFSIGFRESGFDEAPHAAAVAKHLGTDHTTMYVTAQDALDVIPKLPGIYNEPFADSSQIPTTLLASLARQHVTVSLSGDGGDELFGGYARYPMAERTWTKLNRVPRSMRAAASGLVMAIAPEQWNLALKPTGLHARGITGDRLHKLAELFDAPNATEFYRDLVSAWRRPSSVVRNATEPATALMAPFAGGRGGLLAEMMLHDQVSYLPDDILVKVDRAAMAASLESRAPLLDHRIAEFAWRLPAHNWRRDGQGKWIVRQVLDRYVPRTLVERPKQGFGIPVNEWLRGPLRDWADDLLSPDALRREGLFNHAPIVTAWSEHRSGTRNWAPALWSILMFQAWRRA